MSRERTIYTVGHSTHEFEAFVELLKQHGVTALADVRSRPFSRLSCFNRDELRAGLKAQGIHYVFMGRELGARRDELDCYVGQHADYERIADLPAFKEGISRLKRGAQKHKIVLMCAEKEPLDCHRSVLICRQLRAEGVPIAHILADGSLEDHDATEQRLMDMMGQTRTLFEQHLNENDLINRAYDARGKEIAYRVEPEGVVPGEQV